MASDSKPVIRRDRALIAVRVGFGLTLLVSPDRALAIWGVHIRRRARIVARILGGRHLAEAGILAVADTRRTAVAGAAVDTVHGGAAFALAARSRRWRRAGLVNAATALGFVALGLLRGTRTD